MSSLRPVDPGAAARADDAFYAAHPEMVRADGSRIPLSASDPAHEPLRAEWRERYASVSGATAPPGAAAAPPEPEPPGGESPPEDDCEPCEEEEEEEEPTVTVRFGLYFDGTGNNRDNVDEGRRGREGDGFNSYDAAHSNVVKLHKKGASYAEDVEFRIYVEGIGTISGGEDTTLGFGLGTGATGVPERVLAGLDRAQGRIVAGATLPIRYVHADLFGFSRGAAAARLCCFWVLNTGGAAGYSSRSMESRLTRAGKELLGPVEVKFVGLFDTVASYGPFHGDDTAQLRLDSISAAETVVQLAAAEEHRAKFRLTNVNSGGRQYFLPGVHSDVGGGYADDLREGTMTVAQVGMIWRNSRRDIFFDRQRDWLVERGWYERRFVTQDGNRLLAVRGAISNGYATIPLQIMARKAGEGGVPYDGTIATDGGFGVPDDPVLKTAQRTIEANLEGAPSATPGPYMHNDAEWHQELRAGYLHFSARHGETLGAHDPDYAGSGMDQRRRRTIQDG